MTLLQDTRVPNGRLNNFSGSYQSMFYWAEHDFLFLYFGFIFFVFLIMNKNIYDIIVYFVKFKNR